MHTLKANFHIHSLNSDGIHSAKRIVKAAQKYGVSAFSITDHNEIAGSLKGEKLAEKAGLIFFPGIELMFGVRGRVYEVLAYFYDGAAAKKFYQEYRYQNGFAPHFKSVSVVIEMIHKHKGVAIAAHPYGRKGIFRGSRHKEAQIDGIEIINAFTATERNHRARKHQGQSEGVELGAADMHFFRKDISRVYTQLTSAKAITKKAIWDNLTGKSKTIEFKPVGENFSRRKIFFQKPLCVVIYTLNYPRLYSRYRTAKIRSKMNSASQLQS